MQKCLSYDTTRRIFKDAGLPYNRFRLGPHGRKKIHPKYVQCEQDFHGKIIRLNYRKEIIYLKQNNGAPNVSRKETSGGPNLSRFYEKNKFAKIEGGPMCRCLIWGPNLNLLYGSKTVSLKNFHLFVYL